MDVYEYKYLYDIQCIHTYIRIYVNIYLHTYVYINKYVCIRKYNQIHILMYMKFYISRS
jgi:hypothetical protein